jgi:cytochrome P450
MTETVPAFPATRAPGCPFEPPPEFAELRAQESVARTSTPAGVDVWTVSRYDDVRAVLTAPGISSRCAPSMHVTPGADLAREVMPGNILQLDGPAHARLRRMLTAEFTVRRVEALRPYIQRIVDEHIDELLAGPNPTDFYETFALPIPSLVICELLGVPYADREMFHKLSAVVMRIDTDREIAYTAYGQIRAYMQTLFTAKLTEPGDDLMSRMIERSRESGQPLTVPEMVELGTTLLIAGHETTANMIALSTAALLQHPAELDKLRSDPDLAPSAVEEMLRYLSVIQFGLLRQATQDISVGSMTVKSGEWLVAALGAGNRDASVYSEPDAIDLQRKAKTHLAFGFGIHQCVGQQLARVELQEVYARLFRRIPSLKLAVPFDAVEFKDKALVYGVEKLPVTWEA